MTAIKKYQILESKGFWIESKGKEVKEVIISFGKSSIIISDTNATPLDHWNFNSIVILQKRTTSTTFSPGPEREEKLIVKDEEMIEAMTIICEHSKIPSKPMLKFNHVIKLVISLLLVFFFFSLPSMLRFITLDIIEPYHEVIFVNTLLAKKDSVGNICPKQKETVELEKMIASSYGIETGINISITKSSLPSPAILPGGVIIVPFDWFLQSESYQKFEALLKLALGAFEGRKVFIYFLKEQKLSTLLYHILGLDVQFRLNLGNYYVSDNELDMATNTSNYIKDEEWISIRNSCLN